MELLQYLNPSIIVVAIALYVVIRYLCRNTKSGSRRLPPEAGGAWPILGHLHLFRGSTLLHVALGEMADKYGPAFTIRIGVHRVLVVSDRELAKDLFTAHDVKISCRPRSRAAKHLGYNYVMFGFSPYGPYWRELRRLTSSELLSGRRLEQLKHIRVSEIETSIKELYKFWKGIDLNGYDADTVTKSACINLVAGGADTIKVMLIWTLSLIMNHPHVLKKVQEELDMVIGKERRINELDITSLIYLQAIVKETLRLYPAGPMLHLVMANLLHSFELSTLGNAPIDMTESTGLTNIKATPLEILLTPRLSFFLY
nr:cytochrome P450 CYP82D47-like [Ipomoea batatas]